MKPKFVILPVAVNMLLSSCVERYQTDIDKLIDFPIFYIDYNSTRLRFGYSGMVQQYSLSETVYKYLAELKKINESGGSLYDAAPSALRGNVVNVNDAKEAVLRVFKVSGISEKRFFVKESDLPHRGIIPDGFSSCDLLAVPLSDTVRLDSLLNVGWEIMDTNFFPRYLNVVNYLECFDCRVNVTEKK